MTLREGLMQLRQFAISSGLRIYDEEKTPIIPIYSFINQLIASMKRFVQTHEQEYWLTFFLSEHYRDKSLSHIIKTWEKLTETSLQCHLLQLLLVMPNKNKHKLYLKARKYIVQTASNSFMLDEVLLNLQDSISIIHKLYQNEQIRKALAQGIKNIFLAFKMSEAKIYSSVFIEYLLTVYDSIFRVETEQATISGQLNQDSSIQSSSNYIELYSSISNFQSGIHEENGLYKKTNNSQPLHKKYQIIDRKFLPLKETSQFISNQTSNKFSSSAQKRSDSKEKSEFYQFITQSSLKQQQSSVFERPSNPRKQNNNPKIHKKQQSRVLEKEGRRADQPINDKQNSSFLYKMSKEKYTETEASKSKQKFSIQRFINQPSEPSLNKKFELNWLSKKMFQTSDNEQRDSILRKSKAKLQRDISQKKKLLVTSVGSTQKYQIQNHLLKGNPHMIGRAEGQNSRVNTESGVESVKREDFERMISKNQQFKEKMLKKNYPSNTFNESLKNLQSILNNYKPAQQNSFSDSLNPNSIRSEVQSSHQVHQSSNINNSSFVNQRRSKVNVQRSQKQNTDSRIRDSRSKQKVKYPNKRHGDLQHEQNIRQKPQNVRKGVGERQQHPSKYSRDDKIIQNQNSDISSQYEPSQQVEKPSFDTGKMKQILQMVNNYQQKTNNLYPPSKFKVSQSFCKRSSFNSNDFMGMNSAGDYSFES